MNILALDQARNGAWSVFDYDTKTLVAYGTFQFPTTKYTFAKAMYEIYKLTESLMNEYNIVAVYIEDIQLRQNVDSFKKLAQLQGCLVALFERNEYLYGFVPPARWQSFCGARGRTSKEVKANASEASLTKSGKKPSKMLSIQYIKSTFGIETTDDNLADAICIGYYVCNNVEIKQIELKENEA